MANICSTEIVIPTSSLEESNEILSLLDDSFYSKNEDDWDVLELYTTRKQVEDGRYQSLIEKRLNTPEDVKYFSYGYEPITQELLIKRIKSDITSWGWLIERVAKEDKLVIQFDCKWNVQIELIRILSKLIPDKTIDISFWIECIWRWYFKIKDGVDSEFKSYHYKWDEKGEFMEVEDK